MAISLMKMKDFYIYWKFITSDTDKQNSNKKILVFNIRAYEEDSWK